MRTTHLHIRGKLGDICVGHVGLLFQTSDPHSTRHNSQLHLPCPTSLRHIPFSLTLCGHELAPHPAPPIVNPFAVHSLAWILCGHEIEVVHVIHEADILRKGGPGLCAVLHAATLD